MKQPGYNQRVRGAMRRIELAAARRDIGWVSDRKFDSYFEFYDGAEVAAAIREQCKTRPELMAVVNKCLGSTLPKG